MKKATKTILILFLVLCLGFGGTIAVEQAVSAGKQKTLRAEAAASKTDGPFYAGAAGSFYYRIPALYTTQDGTVVASADARFGGTQDSANNLDTATAISTDNGGTWEQAFLSNHFIDFADCGTAFIHSGKISFAAKSSASFIDASLLEDTALNETGRLFQLVDIYPSGGGIWTSEAGSGYTEVDGQKYLKLRKKGSSKYSYTLREDNRIYDENAQPTAYSVNEKMEILKDGAPLSVRQKDVWYLFNLPVPHPTGTEVPMNIMYGSALFQPLRTSYLALTYSDDQGRTWSSPVLLNDQVKEEGMTFLGVGPGRGHQIETGAYQGRLLFPVYTLDPADKKQLCRMLYSDDHGQSWRLGQPPELSEGITYMSESQLIELPDGSLQLFARNDSPYVATAYSRDGGITWSKAEQVAGLPTGGSSCQLTAINLKQTFIDGQPAVLLARPAEEGRQHGVISIGLIEESVRSDNGYPYSIQWNYHYDVNGSGEAYAYSCLTELADGKIGLLYEQGSVPQPFDMINFKTFSLAELTGGQAQLTTINYS